MVIGSYKMASDDITAPVKSSLGVRATAIFYLGCTQTKNGGWQNCITC
jgi:hypothetical protein